MVENDNHTLFILRIGDGSFAEGFPTTLQIFIDGSIDKEVKLPAIPSNVNLPSHYQRWLKTYNQLGDTRKIKPVAGQQTHGRLLEACRQATTSFEEYCESWFQQGGFEPIRNLIWAESQARSAQQVPVILHVDTGSREQDVQLRKIPWHLWQLFDDDLPDSEMILNAGFSNNVRQFGDTVNVLAIFGSAEGGLKLDKDLTALEQLQSKGAVITALKQPTREQLHQHLWQNAWDVIAFAGHSASEAGYRQGHIQIRDDASLPLKALKQDLKHAVEQGLKLAIFNSCDGLGIADYLMDLKVPIMIVMKEPVPDLVARKFLRYFLEDFCTGQPLHTSVRTARKRLHWLESNDEGIPCPAASWLPVVYQNPNQPPLRWPIKSLVSIMKKIPPIAYLFLLGLGLGGYWGLEQWLSGNASRSSSLSDTLSISSKPTFADVTVPAPPKDVFRFAGSTASAALLCEANDDADSGGIHAQIQAVHPRFQLQYVHPETGVPSSGKGLELLMNNQVDFILSSRLPKPEEEEQAIEQNFELRTVPIAQYATAYSVHPEVGIATIKGLTLDDLGKIFSSDTRLDWRDFGGAPQQIAPYAHEAEKGALYIGERRLGRFGSTVKFVETTTKAMQAISDDYGGIYRAPSVLTFGQATVTTMPVTNTGNREEAVLPFTDLDFNPAEACRNLDSYGNPQAPIDNRYPAELQEPFYVVFKDYPGDSNLQEQAGRAYAELLSSGQGREMLSAIGFQPAE